MNPSALSPSLRSEADPPAYELKFLLSESQAREVQARIEPILQLDPNADPALGGAYRTTSLYSDTQAMDVYLRRGSLARDKYRVRRYGEAPILFLERKTKWGRRVQKHRTSIPHAQEHGLAQETRAEGWEGAWFHEQVLALGLRPVCLIAYERLAFIGPDVRLTFDRRLQGKLIQQWSVASVQAGVPFLTEQVICEIKFQGVLPAFFKAIVQELNLAPSTVSKYRRFVQTAGIAPQEQAAEEPGS